MSPSAAPPRAPRPDAATVGHHHHDEHPAGEPLARKASEPLRVGVAGPIGSGKTTLIAELYRALAEFGYEVGVVTNDVYTAMDAHILTDLGVPEHRVVGVATGGCPHTAIRDDVSINEEAIATLIAGLNQLDIVFVESGGDNLTTTFSRELVHRWICVIDVAGGDKVPAKGGPGVTASDLFFINKTDLAPHVGASVERMLTDASIWRVDGLPVIAGTCRSDDTVHEVTAVVRTWEKAGT